MKKNSCTPINPKKCSCNGLNKIHAKNLITKKNSCSSKIPLPPHNFSNGPSLRGTDMHSCHILIKEQELLQNTRPRYLNTVSLLSFVIQQDVHLYRTCGVHSKLTYSQIVLDKSLFLFSPWFSNPSLIFVVSHTHKNLIVSSQTSLVAKLVILA